MTLSQLQFPSDTSTALIYTCLSIIYNVIDKQRLRNRLVISHQTNGLKHAQRHFLLILVSFQQTGGGGRFVNIYQSVSLAFVWHVRKLAVDELESRRVVQLACHQYGAV